MFVIRRMLCACCCALILCLSGIAISLRAQTVGFVFVSNVPPASSSTPPSILGFVINAHTGGLTPTASSPLAVPLAGSAPLAVSPSQRLLYAPVSTAASTGLITFGVAAYTIDSNTGALTPISGSPFTIGSTSGSRLIRNMVVDPTGRFLYVYDSSNGQIWVYTIDATSGALTPLPNAPFFDTRLDDGLLTVDTTGQFFYVVCTSINGCRTNQINAFRFDPNSGTFASVAGSPFTIPGDTSSGFRGGPVPGWTTSHPSGFLYVGDTTQKDIWTYAIDSTSGALTLTASSPMHIPQNSNQLAVHPSGRFGYLTTPFPNPTNCANFFPYTDTHSPESVFEYTVTDASGALSPISGSPMAATGYEPVPISIDPSGRFAYVLNLQGFNFDPNSSTVSAYTIDPSSGTLTEVLGSPFAAGANAFSIVATVVPN